MTEEKKVVTRKTTAKKVEPKVEPKREITLETEVEVYNNTSGLLVYSARKGGGYLHLDDFMDSDFLTVGELQQMRNTHKAALENGWIYVDNEEVLDFLRLGKLKDKVQSPHKLEEVLDSGLKKPIMDILDKLGTESKMSFYKLLQKKVKNEEFSNINIIKAVEEKLGIDPEKSLLVD